MIYWIATLFLSISLNHDFHMSKCEMNYDVEDQAIEIILQIFTDDLEESIAKETSAELKLHTDHEHVASDSLVNAYLQSHLQVTADNQQLQWEYIGKENTEDLSASVIYLEIIGIDRPEEIVISNDILMELFDDQRNMLQCLLSSKAQGYYMMQGKDKTFTWEL